MILLVGAIILLVWYVFARYLLNTKSSNPSSNSPTSPFCPSPDCVRCSDSIKSTYSKYVGEQLQEMYSKFGTEAVQRVEERLTFEVSTLPVNRRPTVCFMSDMCKESWQSQKLQFLQDTLTDSYSSIKKEVGRAMANRNLWCVSDTDSGCWQKLFLYNQGIKVEENCAQLPQTAKLIAGLDAFMADLVFGNAFVSILDEQSSVEPHCGPTNLRVRCHMGLQIPSGECSLTVDRVKERWSDQQCLLFDDSFLHSANNLTDSPRVVLIVDFWHPNLTFKEIQILGELFAVKR